MPIKPGRKVNGTSSILQGARLICRIVGRFGTAGLVADTTPELGAAVAALVVACKAFDALDDFPAEIDDTAPVGKEDVAGD